MYAFYACRGYTLDDLAALSYYEKMFLRHAQVNYWNEQRTFYKSLFGGEEK